MRFDPVRRASLRPLSWWQERRYQALSAAASLVPP